MNEVMNTMKDSFSNLPQELQAVILDPQTRQKIKSACQKNILSPEQSQTVELEVFLILFGFETLNRFRANIVDKADITYDQALKISFEMNQEVFKPVTEILKDIEDAIKKGGAENTPADSSEVAEAPDAAVEPGETAADGATNRATESISQTPTRNEPETHPDHIIVDHETMTRTDGAHLHSQNVMPVSASQVPISQTPPPQAPQPKPAFKSIDEKLSGLVRSSSTVNTANKYKGNDPYREPIA